MYHFIVNPNSRSGHGRKVWEIIRDELKDKDIPHEIYFTKYRRHATELTADICQKYPDSTVVAVGGDGTVNEVVSGLHNLSTITFGYIPTGSGNDFARSMKIPKDTKAALDLIVNPPAYTTVDIGIVSTEDGDHRFIVSSGLGWDAAICHEAITSSIKRILNKFKLGKLTYVGIALKQILLYKPCSLTVYLDEEKKLVYPKAFFAAVMNQPYEGGGCFFAPKASSNDGRFDICLIGALAKLKILALLPTAYIGKHVLFKGVHILNASKIELQADRPLPLHYDGEAGGVYNRVVLSFFPEKLRMIIPKQ